jgi:hypothetical protein
MVGHGAAFSAGIANALLNVVGVVVNYPPFLWERGVKIDVIKANHSRHASEGCHLSLGRVAA